MTTSSTTLAVREQPDFAQPLPFEPGMGEVAKQSGFQPVLRRQLMAALSMTGRELGLRPASLMVLDVLLSFLPCTDASGKDMPVTPLHLLTIYAANETISFRARGLTDRQLRRHFDILERHGFIQRRDSANGKRFPIYQNGKVVGAYGIDLMPLFSRADAVMTRAAQLREEQQEIRGLKARIGQLRAQLLAQAPALPEDAVHFLEQLRNLTRRVGLTLIEAKALLVKLSGLSAENSPTANEIAEKVDHSDVNETVQVEIVPHKPSASAGQNVRHNKPKNSYTKKSQHAFEKSAAQDFSLFWARLCGLNEFFPKQPESIADLLAILGQTGNMLRINMVYFHHVANQLAPLQLAQIFDRILRNHATIQSPDAYFRSAVRTELAQC